MLDKPYYTKTFERHENDLKAVRAGLRDDIRFNKKLGVAYVAVIENLKHFEGEWAGELIKLEDWQKRAIAICFGWQKKRLNKDGEPLLKAGEVQWIRRFNTAFWFIPRKNGKSILASGVCIAESILTVEKGNQIVSFATKKDQAKIIWNGCEKMVNSNKELKLILEDFVKSAESQIDIASIVLFGSYAKGSATKESDIDVLLISREKEGIDKVTKEIHAKYGKEISIVLMAPKDFKKQKDNALIKEIINSHYILYGIEKFVNLVFRK